VTILATGYDSIIPQHWWSHRLWDWSVP